MIPDYYSLLSIPETATQQQILQSYQRLALIYHPDFYDASRLVGNTTTVHDPHEHFHKLADAYYTLSDPLRRQEYDKVRVRDKNSITTVVAGLGMPDADAVFSEAFEDLLKPEVENAGHAWSIVGGASGATLGFIVANVPGALVGSFVGSALGQVRDRKGKSIYEVFQGLSKEQRYKVLAAVARKLLT
jgi:curved DNA-binding protein CbpA